MMLRAPAHRHSRRLLRSCTRPHSCQQDSARESPTLHALRNQKHAAPGLVQTALRLRLNAFDFAFAALRVGMTLEGRVPHPMALLPW